MSTVDIVQKLWNLCNVLRDDGITYHQYVTELTYILFLKMLDETGEENTLKADVLKAYQKSLEQYARKKGKAVEQLTEEEKESRKPLLYNYSWEYLTTLEGIELKNYYMKLLSELGSTGIPKISDIYAKAVSSIEEPKNLQKIISEINKLDWFEAKQEGLGDLYEGLLQKNADEKKSGAGQYFTPRVLIDVMTDLISPKLGEKCFDKTTPRLIQFHTFKNAANPPFLGGFSIFGTVVAEAEQRSCQGDSLFSMILCNDRKAIVTE